MTLELFIELLLIAGIVSGKTPCKTWELNGNNISLICRIKNQVEPVTFIDDSKWNLKDKCTLNNTRKCEIFHINADTIAYTYENEIVLVINDYERKCVINDEWTCSEGNSTLKTVVSTSKGILSDTILKLSLLNSPTLQRVTLICYSSRTPHGYHVEFLKNGKSVDSITFNMVSRKCTHIGGECLPDKCSCSPFGNNFTRKFPFIAGNITTTFSCSMKFVDNDTSSKLLKIATVLFDKQAFIYIGTNTSILKPAENENKMNDENRNMPDGRNIDRTETSLNIVNPDEIIKWVAIGVAFAMPCIVAIIFKEGYRVFRNSKKKHDENKSILELDCKHISRKDYETEPILEFRPLMDEKEISGKDYETEPVLECRPLMDEKEILGKYYETEPILEFRPLMDEKEISEKHFSTEPTLECQPLIMPMMNEKEISGKDYETEPVLECRPLMDEKEILDMDFPNLSEESINVSKTLAAHNIILPVVKLRREEAMYQFNVLSIFYCHHTDHVVMPCGSRAEGLPMLTERHQAYLSSSDEDFIIFANYFKVCETRSEFLAMIFSKPISYHVLRIPDAAYPGYSKLEVSQHAQIISEWPNFQGSKLFLKNSLKETIINSFIGKFHNTVHGPAVKIDLRSHTSTSSDDIERNGPKKFEFKNIDYVLCLRGKSWPNEALEWKKRKRSSKWLSKELFDNIIRSGYLLAGVGHRESENNEIQWRVSFNTAEQVIIESFNETQIQCLILLRLLKGSRLSKLAGKNITSYTMKTVMFWSLDEIKNECWQPHNLLYCFCFCLLKLKLFVEEEFLPDYFIRKRNLFISSEFTRDEQTHTRQFLISFLEKPKENISFLLSSYNMNQMHQHLSDQEMFIKTWLYIRFTMATYYHDLMNKSFCNLYDGYNIENILLRCKTVSEKLTRIKYAQPFIKLLQNCMCVLQYMLLRKEKEKFGYISDSGTRRQCLEYMKSSLAADRTHTALRVATCHLDEGANKRNLCIALIRSVTDHPNSHLYMHTYSNLVKDKLENFQIQAFEKLQPSCLPSEIPIYNEIISKDLISQDPYITIEQFKLLKKQGKQVGWHSAFLLVWEQCWFDVTFMPAELPVLPKPVALELCIDHSLKKISFHPFLYGLLLEFLWHAKYSSTKEKAGRVLGKMKGSIEIIPHQQQSIGLNFITYCCSIQNDSRSASQYLIRSFKLNPVKQNVAYLYIRYILNIMRELLFNDYK